MSADPIPLGAQQAIADLAAVAGDPGLPVPATIQHLGADALAVYRQAAPTVRSAPDWLSDSLWAAAHSPEDDPLGSCVAVAYLLARAVHAKDRSDNWLWVWKGLAPAIASAPRPVRAALANGFQAARRLGIAHDDVLPREADCTTEDRETVIDRLLPGPRSLGPEARRRLASSDRHSRPEEHLPRLEALLARSDCHIADGDAYYPAEAVELCAYDPKHPEFPAATALVLIWSLQDEGYEGFLDFRWAPFHRFYRDLQPPWRRPILAGFRHAYETRELFEDDWWTGGWRSQKRANRAKRAKLRAPPVGPIPWFLNPQDTP